MEIARVKEKILSSDKKIKISLFLMIILFVATVPKSLILPLGTLFVLMMVSKSFWSGIFYFFSTAFRFLIGFGLLLLILYFIMLGVVYFFT